MKQTKLEAKVQIRLKTIFRFRVGFLIIKIRGRKRASIVRAMDCSVLKPTSNNNTALMLFCILYSSKMIQDIIIRFLPCWFSFIRNLFLNGTRMNCIPSEKFLEANLCLQNLIIYFTMLKS